MFLKAESSGKRDLFAYKFNAHTTDKSPWSATDITSVNWASTFAPTNGTTGTISVEVVFRVPVAVTGTPQITIKLNGVLVVCNYASSSTDKKTLTFTSIAQSFTTSHVLTIEADKIGLNGGTILHAQIGNIERIAKLGYTSGQGATNIYNTDNNKTI